MAQANKIKNIIKKSHSIFCVYMPEGFILYIKKCDFFTGLFSSLNRLTSEHGLMLLIKGAGKHSYLLNNLVATKASDKLSRRSHSEVSLQVNTPAIPALLHQMQPGHARPVLRNTKDA